ncbi:MAG: protein-arginine deiminase domain-containing protein, partial [Kiritimatiellaeota bacterium]|nr:protein-arginine deiminase domain-containing protein [Kiritimatiellota bacterium]
MPTNFHVAAAAARKTLTDTAPDAFSLSATHRAPSNRQVSSDDLRLKTAPLILPPECNPAEEVYSTYTNYFYPPIKGITKLPVTQTSPLYPVTQFTQDMLKFASVQFNDKGNTDAAVGLGHLNAGNLMSCLTNPPMLQVDWGVGLDLNGNPANTLGNGGNIMATPPCEDAPYGKIMIGTKWPQTRVFWEAQDIQPIINISNNWLVVGHVDELFMWVSPTKVIYADPWVAADMLHYMIANDGGMATLWCGYKSSDKTNTISGAVIDNNRNTRL